MIDANKLDVIKTIALPATSFQLALSPDGKTLAVACKDALKVSLIDTATEAIVKTVAIGKEPEGVFKGAMMKHPYWSKDGLHLIEENRVRILGGAVEQNIRILEDSYSDRRHLWHGEGRT